MGNAASPPTDTQDTESGDEPGVADRIELPEWDDAYFDQLAGRLVYNYDLEKDRRVEGESFELYGQLSLTSKKHFLHPALSFAHHESTEHLFATRREALDVSTLDRFVELGHELADEWIEPDEEHFSTDFTFVVVADDVTDDVRDRVDGFQDRTLLKYGYNGHYEISLIVVDPERETIVASPAADATEAARVWADIEREEPGIFGLIARRFQL